MLRRFCGPARATVTIERKTFHLSGGRCQILDGGRLFTVNIGAVGPWTSKPKYAYFGADVRPPKAGIHIGQGVAIAVAGKRYSLPHTTVTVKTSLRGGTFSGAVVGHGAASGSFTC